MGGRYGVVVLALLSALVGGVAALTVQPYLAPSAPPTPSPPGLTVRDVPPGIAGASPAVQVAERVGPAVVGITTEAVLRDIFTGRSFVEPRGTGSGVIFDPRGEIVTNYHVVENADRLVVVLADGRRLEGDLAGADPATDLAVVRVKTQEDLPAATFADSDQVRVGETAIAIGTPLGLEFQRSVTTGVVSGIRSFLYGQEAQFERVFQLIQTDAAINPGNSGGALVNAAGQVIGINTFKFGQDRNVEGMGFAIPSNTVKRVADDLARYGRVRRARLGVQFVAREAVEQFTGRRVEQGLVIGRLAPGGPAERAGLESLDVILALDGEKVNEAVDAVRVLELKRPGDRLTLLFLRDGRRQTVTVILDELASR